jgi:hypothetical protein
MGFSTRGGLGSLPRSRSHAATLVCQHRLPDCGECLLASATSSKYEHHAADQRATSGQNAGRVWEVLNVSSPRLLGRSAQEDVLGERLAGYALRGAAPSRWIGSGEFETIAANWNALDQCVCSGNGEGFTLEIPLGKSHAAIRLSTNQTHPQLGNGLHGNLKLPLYDNTKCIAERCASLNLRETMWTSIPQFGCWYPFCLVDDHACPQFSLFIPNALYGEGIASLMVLWLYQRYQLVFHGEFPD